MWSDGSSTYRILAAITFSPFYWYKRSADILSVTLVVIKAVEVIASMEPAFVHHLHDLVRGRSNQRFKENFRGTWNAAVQRVTRCGIVAHSLSENYESS